jgi:hypothetical protein
MSNTEHAGVSHNDIIAAVASVREAAPAYNWKCVPAPGLGASCAVFIAKCALNL